MPVVMSYSHQDKEFVDRLAAHLVKHRAWVWVDRWELSVGDSIVQRVQTAIKEASALIVVLSKASVQSEWCKKELTAGLVRELEEKRVVVLPALLEDCDIPLFLRDKLFADFRKDFSEGLRATLATIAKVTSDSLGRTDTGIPGFHEDWSIDIGMLGERVLLVVTIVGHGSAFPYSVLSEIQIMGNEVATSRYREYERRGLGWLYQFVVAECLNELGHSHSGDCILVLDEAAAVTQEVRLGDPRTGVEYTVMVKCRRLGEDTGKDVIVNWGQQIEQVIKSLRVRTRKATPEEMAKMAEVLRLGFKT